MGKKRQWQELNDPTPPELNSDNLPQTVSVGFPGFSQALKSLNYNNVPSIGFRPSAIRPTTTDKYTVGSGMPWYSEEYMKGENQSAFSKFTNGFISRGLSIVPKILQGLGHVGGSLEYALNYMEDPETADPNVIWDNAMVDAMTNMDEGLKEMFPVHATKRYAEGNLLKQMGTANFWADDLFDGIAFAISAWAPVAGFGKIGKALALTKEALPAFQLSASTIYNTISESGFEADEINKRMRDELSYEKFKKSYDMLTKGQRSVVNYEAGSSASETFKANTAILAVPNLVQSYFFASPMNKVAKSIRKSVQAGNITAQDVAVFSRGFKQASLGIVTEGLWEEGAQAAIQSYQQRKRNDISSDPILLTYLNEWIDNFSTTDGQKAMMLGAILGGFMGFSSGVREGLHEMAMVQFEEDRDNYLAGLLADADLTYIESIKSILKPFKRTVIKKDAEGKDIEVEEVSYLNDKGVPEIDLEKVNKLFYQTVHDKRVWDEFLVSVLNNDPIHAEVIKDEALARRFYKFVTNPKYEDVSEAVEDLRRMDFQTEVPEGLVDKEDIDSKLSEIAKVFEESENALSDIQDFTDDDIILGYKRLVRKALFMEGIKRMSLQKSLSLTENQESKDQLQRLIDDSNKFSQELRKSGTKSGVFEIYKNNYRKAGDINQRILDEQKKENPDNDLIESLKYDLEEKLSIHGEDIANSDFSIIYPEVERLGDFGLRNKFFYEQGMDALVSMRAMKLADDVKNGKSEINDLTNYILNNKKKINKGDQQIVRDVADYYESVAQKAEERAKIAQTEMQELTDRMTEEQVENILSGMVSAKPIGDEAKYLEKQQIINEAIGEVTYADMVNDSVDQFIKDTDKRLKDKSFDLSVKNEELFFKRQHADIPINESKDIVNLAKANKKYDKVSVVQESINKLERNKRLFSKDERKKLLKGRYFKNYIESIDKAIADLKAILPDIVKNKNDIEAKDEKALKNSNESYFHGIGLAVDQDKGGSKVTEKKINDKLKELVGDEFYKEVLEDASKAKIGEKNARFDKVFVYKILNKIKSIKKESDFIGTIQQAIDDKVKQLEKLYRKLDRWEGSDLVNQLISAYLKNPVKNFLILIANAKGSSKTDEQIHAIDKYLNDKDILGFRNALREEKTSGYEGLPKDFLLSFLDLQVQIEGMSKVMDYLESDLDIRSQISTEKDLIESEDFAPANQQLNAIREIVTWFRTATGNLNKRFAGWVLNRGLAGTGKTKFVARWVLNSLGLKKDNYLAVAHAERQLQTLVESIKPEKPGVLIKDLTPDKVDENIKVIVTDEVGAYTSNELDELADKLIEINKGRKEPVRIYALGDPSQIKRTILRGSPLSEANKFMMHEVTPLTVVHRSDISAVLDFQDVFQDNLNKVRNIPVNASTPLGVSGIGVHVTYDSRGLIEQIRANKDSGRTKVVVVYDKNSRKAKEYASEGIEVLNFDEVPGIEVEEVYIDLDVSEFGGLYEFNTAVYTAASRAMQYIAYLDHSGTFQQRQGAVMPSDKSLREKIEQKYDDYLERLEFEESVLTGEPIKTKVSKPKSKSNVKIVDKDVSNVQESDANDVTGKDEAGAIVPGSEKKPVSVKVVTKGGVHELAYPEHGNINYHKKGIFGPLVSDKHSPQVKYIATLNQDTGKPEIQIVAEQLNDDGSKVGDGVYALIGIVGLEDIDENKTIASIHQQMLDLQKEDIVWNGIKGGKLREDADPRTILLDGKLKFAQPLTYVYSDKIKHAGVGLLSKIASIFERGFFSPGKRQEVKYSVKIFKYKDEIDGIPIENTSLKVGMPYLIIKTTAWKRLGKGQDLNYQFIRLNPRNLKFTDRGIDDLNKFAEAIYAIEAIEGLNGRLGDEAFNTLLKRWKANYELNGKEIVKKDKTSSKWTWEAYTSDPNVDFLTDITEEQFNQIDKLIDPVIRLFYGHDLRKVAFSSEEEMREAKDDDGNYLYKDSNEAKYVFVKSKNSKIGHVKKIDPIDEKDKGTFMYREDLVGGSGQAQMALNLLAKANSHIGGNNFRVIHTRRDKVTKRVAVSFQAKSLLANKSSYGAYWKHIKDLFEKNISDEVRNEFPKFIPFMTLQDKIEDALIKSGLSTREELDKVKSEHTTPSITSDELRTLLSFDQNGLHETLRRPLGYDEVNKLGEDLDLNQDNSDLEEMLVTNFENVLPTRIQVELKKAKKIEDQEEIEAREKIKEKNIRRIAIASKLKNKIGELTEENVNKFLESNYWKTELEDLPLYEGMGRALGLTIEEIQFIEEVTQQKNIGKAIDEFREQVEIDLRDTTSTPIKEKPKEKSDTSSIIDEIEDLKDGRGSALRKSQNTKLGKRISLTEARNLAKKMIPYLTVEELQFVDQITMNELAGEDHWGLFQNGVVYILKNEDDTIYKNVVAHEIFHKVLTQYLTEEEKTKLWDEFIKEYPEYEGMRFGDVEEAMAEKFQTWRTNPLAIVSRFIKKIFKKILAFFNLINDNKSQLDKYFNRIHRGYFARNNHVDPGVQKSYKDIIDKWGGVDNYLDARAIVAKKIKKYLDEGYENLPITRKEIYELVLIDLIELRKKVYDKLSDMLEVQRTKGYTHVEFGRMSSYKSLLDKITELKTIRGKEVNVNYNALIADIYPHRSFKPADIINPTEKLSEADIIDNFKRAEEGAVGKHTINSDEINHETKISESVKDFLSDITVNGKYMSWREAYIRALQLLQGLQSNQPNFINIRDRGKDQLEEAWKLNGSSLRTKAVMDRLRDLYEEANSIEYLNRSGRVKRTKVSNNMKFVDEDTFIYGDRDITDINTATEAELNNQHIVRRGSNESTKDFLNRLASRYGQNKYILGELMWKSMALNNLSEVIHNFISQKEKNIRIAERIEDTNNKDVYIATYIVGKAIGVGNAIKSQLRNAIRDLFVREKGLERYRNNKFKAIKDKMDESIKNNPDEDPDRYRAIFVKEFINSLHSGIYIQDVVENDLGVVTNDIIKFIDHYTSNANSIDKLNNVIETEGGSFIENVADIISYNDELTRATSFVGSEGKIKYMWSPSTFVHDIMFAVSGRMRRGRRTLRLPKYFDTPFFNKNIYISKIARIHRISEHDGTRIKYRSGYTNTIPYKNETEAQWMARNFVHSFLASIGKSRKGSESYHQQFYTPADRTNLLQAQVSVMTPRQIKDAIRLSLEQISERTDEFEKTLENYDKTNLIGFEILREVIKNRDIRKNPIKSEEIPKLVTKIYDQFDNKARRVAQFIIDNRIELGSDLHTLAKIDNYIDKELFPNYKREKYANYSDPVTDGKMTRSVNEETGEYNFTIDDLLPLTHSFVTNQYMHSYHLMQLILGDLAQFEDSETLLKRLETVFAPGTRGYVSKNTIPEKFKMLVMKDPNQERNSLRKFLQDILKRDDVDYILKKFPKKGYKPGDGQGFMLPERAEQLVLSYGKAFNLGNVMKPVIMDVNDQGITRAVKYSVVVLTDELVNRFKPLENLRNKMRDGGYGEAVFNSGVKVGNPHLSLLPSWDDLISEDALEINEDSVFDINSVNYRMQLNPVSDDRTTALPTQLAYFLNVLDWNKESAARVYDASKWLMEDGLNKIQGQLSDRKSLRRKLMSLFSAPGQERFYDMLREGLSVNFPALVDKSVVQLSNAVLKSAINIRFRGGGLVLQSQLGVTKPNGERLMYKEDKSGKLLYAEVIISRGILPKKYEDIIDKAWEDGVVPSDIFALNDAFGFRNPSSELHSGVPLKIVGLYDQPGTNIAITPQELIPIMGSDFDVDELWMVARDYDDDGNPIGYTKNKEGKWSLRPTPKGIKPEDYPSYYRNVIIDEFIKIFTDPKNRETMVTPIYLDKYHDDIDRMEGIRKKPFLHSLDLSDPIDNMTAHEEAFSALKAVGIVANTMKAIAYMMRTGPAGENPKLREFVDEETGETYVANEIEIDGKKYNQLTTENDLFEDFDGLENAALDNMRERILPKMNIRTHNLSAYMMLRALGVDFKIANEILQQPIIKALNPFRGVGYTIIKSAIDNITSNFEQDTIPVTTDMIRAGLKSDIDMVALLKKDSEKLTEKEKEFVVQQRSILVNVFGKARSIASDVYNLGEIIGLLRTMPIEKHEIDKIINISEKIFGTEIKENGMLTDEAKENSRFSFVIDRFLHNNSHIFQALKILRSFNNIIENTYYKHSPILNNFISMVMGRAGFKIKLDDTGKNDELLRDEFIRYFISRYKDFSDVPVWEYTYTEEKGRKVIEHTGYETGQRAFTQHFVNRVRSAKKLLPDNRFLKAIEEQYNWKNKTWSIRFVSGVSMQPLDLLAYQESFRELNSISEEFNEETKRYELKLLDEPIADNEYSQFQQDFVTYGVLTFGLKFGAVNYSTVLPSELYNDVDKNHIARLGRILLPENERDLKKIADHFMLELIVNNSDKIRWFSGQAVQVGTQKIEGKEHPKYHGIDNGIIYDRKYQNDKKKLYPLFIKLSNGGKNTIYIRINKNPADDIIYYQKVSDQNNLNTYNLTDDVLNRGYNIRDAFNPYVRNIQVYNNKLSQHKRRGRGVKKGQIVSLTNYHDIARSDRRFVVINKIDSDGTIYVSSIKADKVDLIAVNEYKNRVYDLLGRPESNTRLMPDGGYISKRGKKSEALKYTMEINEDYFAGNPAVMLYDNGRVYINEKAILDYINSQKTKLEEIFPPFELENEITAKAVKLNNSVAESTKGAAMVLREEYSSSTNILDHLNTIYERTADGHLKRTIDLIRPIIEKYQDRMEINFTNIDGIAIGNWDLASGVITIDLEKNNYTKSIGINRAAFDRTIVHESVHAALAYALRVDSGFRADIIRIHEAFKKTFTEEMLKDFHFKRAYDSVDEFLAYAFTRPKFRDLLEETEITTESKREGVLKKLWRKFMEFIKSFNKNKSRDEFRNLWGSLVNIVENSELPYELINELDEKIEKKLGSDLFNKTKLEETATKEEKDVIDIFDIVGEYNDAEVEIDEKGDEGSNYNWLGNLFKRITDPESGFIRFFINRELTITEDFGKRKADELWKGLDHKTKLRDSRTGLLETHDEFAERLNSQLETGKIRGTILHKMIQLYVEDKFYQSVRSSQITAEIKELASRVDIDPNEYMWVHENIQDIFHNAGINTLMEGVPIDQRDVIATEVKVMSELLKIGGAMDMLVQHSNGRFSIIDWKTGSRFNQELYNNLLKYGQQEIEVTDNQRQRAKLQVMMYAFLLKLNNKNIQFENLSAIWIPNSYHAKRNDRNRQVEIVPYLKMIEMFFKDKQALKNFGLPENIYTEILKKSPKIFMPSEYTSEPTDRGLVEELTSGMITPEQLLEKKILEIKLLTGKEDRFEDLSREDKDTIKKLVEQVRLMYSDPSMQLKPGKEYEIGKFIEWFGNYSDVPHSHVQTWKKYRDKMRNKVEYIAVSKHYTFKKLLEPVKKDYMSGRFGIRKLGLEDINYKELYGFMFKEFDRDGITIERLVQKEDEEYGKLTTNQQRLLDFLNDEIKEWFEGPDAFMNQIATYKEDPITRELRGFTHLEHLAFNEARFRQNGVVTYLRDIYYPGFFPKVMKTPEEVRYDAGSGSNIRGALSKKYILDTLRRTLTDFVEKNYEGFPYGQGKMLDLLPIKFVGSREIENDRNYSHNMEIAYDHFIRGMLYKKYMDGVYAVGKATSHFLAMEKDGAGQPMFENTASFLEKKIIGDIMNRKMRVKYSRLPIRIMNEPVEVDKIIELMMGWVSATIMWLRPMQGGGNGLHARGLTYREALKGSIASTFLNIDGDAIDFTVKDNVFADKIYFKEFVPAAITGRLGDNKMWLLAQELSYLPDNFDYATNRKFLLSVRNRLIDNSNMYMFHAKPEEYVSLTTMVAQLHHLKNPVTGRSLWDSYAVEKDEMGVSRIVWKGGVRGKIKRGQGDNAWYEDIKGLLPEEVAKMKKVHERMQGGYRKEEAANIEIYVMGKAFIQLKKYLPRLLINTYHSKRQEADLGRLRDTMERKDGETIYEWVQRTNEGRWRTFINASLALATGGALSPSYKWSSLEDEQKQNIVDALIVVGMMAIFYGAYLMLFGDEDDDDTLKKWWKMYLVDNLNQQYNPMDLLRTLESSTRPVSLARTYKAVVSFNSMLLALGHLAIGNEENAFTEAGDLRGWNEFKKAIPYLASYNDAYNKLMNQKSLDIDFLQTFENKWR